MTEQKKRRKAARRRVDRPVFCPPDAAGRSSILRILGTICRLVTIFCAAYGLSSLVLSAFFPSADMEPVLLVTFVVVMLVGAMRQHPITMAVGGVLMASGAVYYLISRPYGALGYLRRVFGHGYNAMIDRLYKRGSYGLLRYKVAVPSGGSQAEFVQAFCVLVATVIALLFVLCLIRRVRALWPSLISVLLLVPLFVYNLTVQNGPVLFLIVGISGVLILLAYDRCYRRVDERDTTSTMLFPDHRPPLPEGMTDARQLRRERRDNAKQPGEDEKSGKQEGQRDRVQNRRVASGQNLRNGGQAVTLEGEKLRLRHQRAAGRQNHFRVLALSANRRHHLLLHAGRQHFFKHSEKQIRAGPCIESGNPKFPPLHFHLF
jgi:hypothetical protein